MFVDSSACVRVKVSESEWFRIDSGVGLHHVPLGFQCIYGCSDEEGDGKEGSEISGGWESGDCLASCMQMTWFYAVSWRRT